MGWSLPILPCTRVRSRWLAGAIRTISLPQQKSLLRMAELCQKIAETRKQQRGSKDPEVLGEGSEDGMIPVAKMQKPMKQ